MIARAKRSAFINLLCTYRRNQKAGILAMVAGDLFGVCGEIGNSVVPILGVNPIIRILNLWWAKVSKLSVGISTLIYVVVHYLLRTDFNTVARGIKVSWLV